MRRAGLVGAVLAGAAGAGAAPWAAEPAGRLPAGIREASGLAASRRTPGVYWTHGDSGTEAALFAIGADGAARGRLRIVGAKNVDWEDLASFTLDGRAWLLIADTGDNTAGRGDCCLLLVEEPELGPAPAAGGAQPERVAKVAWRLPVIFPDGPRDVEAVAVDVREERVYLLAKRTTPPVLYALGLRATPSGRPVPAMERVAEWSPRRPATGGWLRLPTPTGSLAGQPTAMDFAADGSAALVLTYGELLVYPRLGDEGWAAALGREPARRAPHGLAQAEAAAFSADGREVWVTSEGARAPLLRWRW